MKYKALIKDYAMIIAGSFLFGLSVNVFIVPLGLYNGGVVGLSQLIRTFLVSFLGVRVHFDLAGIINLIINIPMFILAYRSMSKHFLYGTLVSVLVQTLSMTLIPIATTMLLPDQLSNMMIGAIIGAFGIGLTLRTGCSGGGSDIIGMYGSIHWKHFSVGKAQMIVNCTVYAICALVFELPVAINSIIYAAIYSFVLDRVHLQNIEVSVMIFTKHPEIKQHILKDLVRGVTYWKGQGAYTNQETEVLVTICNKYELPKLKKIIHEYDPKAFVIVNEGLDVSGGFEKRLIR